MDADDADGRLTFWGRACLVLLCVGALGVGGLPLFAGVATTWLLPTLSGPRSDWSLLAVVGYLLAVLLATLMTGDALDRAIERRFRWASPRVSKVAVESIGGAFLWLMLMPMMASGLSAAVAVVVTFVLSLVATPLVDRLAESAPPAT